MRGADWPQRGADLLRCSILAALLVVPFLLGAVVSYFTWIAAIGVALLAVASRARRLHLDPAGMLFLAAFLGFAVVQAIVAILAQRPGDLVFVLNFLPLVLFVPLFTLMGAAARPGNTQLVANLALLGALLCMLYAMIEVWGTGTHRAGVRTIDPIRYGATALLLGFLSLMAVRATHGRARWLYLLGPLAGLVGLLLSGARGSIVALPVVAVIAALAVSRTRRGAVLAVSLVAGTGLLILVAGLLFDAGRIDTLIDFVGQILSGQEVTERSTRLRMVLYEAGLAAVAESPWIGHGWSQIAIAPVPHMPEGAVIRSAPHLHNDPLDFMVAAGVPGLIVYALIIAAPVFGALASVRDSQRQARLYGTLILSTIYLIAGQSSLMLGFEYQTGLYVGLAAVILGYCRDTPPTRSPTA